ncbi:hypothetical protein Tco_0535085 [Tanacetum coccineum]
MPGESVSQVLSIFGSLCTIISDGENLDKLKEKDHVSLTPLPTYVQHMVLENGRFKSAGPTNVKKMFLKLHETATTSMSEPIQKMHSFDDDEFINIFSTPVQDQGETSSCHVESSNMHTFYQHHPSAQRWTKDHPLEQVH